MERVQGLRFAYPRLPSYEPFGLELFEVDAAAGFGGFAGGVEDFGGD